MHRRDTRPSTELVADRSQGVQLATIQELARYGTTEYDWRACEARLNGGQAPQGLIGIPTNLLVTALAGRAGQNPRRTCGGRGARHVQAERLRSFMAKPSMLDRTPAIWRSHLPDSATRVGLDDWHNRVDQVLQFVGTDGCAVHVVGVGGDDDDQVQ